MSYILGLRLGLSPEPIEIVMSRFIFMPNVDSYYTGHEFQQENFMPKVCIENADGEGAHTIQNEQLL